MKMTVDRIVDILTVVVIVGIATTVAILWMIPIC